MNKLILFMAAMISVSGFSALPPQYQNANDLDAMLGFAKSDDRIMSGLVSISLNPYAVTYIKGIDFNSRG